MQPVPDTQSRASVAYTAPFLVYVGLLALEHILGLNTFWAYPIRLIAVLTTLAAFSRPLLKFVSQCRQQASALGYWCSPSG